MTLEMVLVLPILVFVLLVLVELGSYLIAMQAIQGAAMAGAREATLPGASTDSVKAAVVGALSGWSYATALGTNDIVIADAPAQEFVSVTVTVDADKAALNPLWTLPGFDLRGKKIGAQYVLRKE